MNLQCARCKEPIVAIRGKAKWFNQVVNFNGKGPDVSVTFRVEVNKPRGGRLCLRCLGESLARAATDLHGKLVETHVTAARV